MPILLLAPEAIELGEAAWGAYRVYRTVRTAQSLVRAGQAANTMLQSRAAVKGCATCPKEQIPCFKTPPKGTDAEMDRQLKEQQDAINKMSPDKLIDNLKTNRDPVTGKIVRPSDDAATRSAARTKAQDIREAQLTDQYLTEGRPAAQAEADAATDAAKEMAGKQMAHTPDLRAGGDGTLSQIPAGGAENQSIGSQWNTKGDGDGRSRGDILEQEAANAKERGDSTMDIELKRCENVL